MNKKKLSFLVIALLGMTILAFIYRFGAEFISLDDTGNAFEIEKAVKALIIAIGAWVVTRFVNLFYWEPLEKKRGKPVSRIVKDLVFLAIVCCAGYFILISIYGKTVSGIGATLLASGGIIGLAAQDILKDCLSGIILDFSGNYKKGDWIKLPNGVNAQVRDVGLRETTLRLANDTILKIGNSGMLKDQVINYNDSEDGYWGDLIVTLDRTIPVARAKRLLQAAASSAPLVYQKQAKVVAISASDGNIVYKVLFKIAEFSQTVVVQHNVIQSLMQHLIDHKLNIAASSTYVYHWKEEFDEPNSVVWTPAFEAMRLSPLFAECDTRDLEKLASVVKMRRYAPGEIIIAEKTRGTVMYFLAEGIVEISIQVKVAEEGHDGLEEVSSKKHITFLTTNDFFGEGGVLYDSPRNATCSAYTEAVLYELERDDLKRVLKELPDVVVKISEAMVMRRQETASIAEKAQQTLEDRKKQTDEFASALRSFLGL